MTKKLDVALNANDVQALSLAVFEDSLKRLRKMKDVQCSDGNWNYDPYMHGMANGMLFAISLFDDKPPEYLDAPEKWLADMPNTELPVSVVQ